MIREDIKTGKQAAVETSNLGGRYMVQRGAFGVLWITGIITVVVLALVIGYVGSQGIHVINWEFLSTMPRGGLSGEGGISSTIVTTIYLAVMTLTVATPLGVFAAIYLVEYAEEIRGAGGIIPKLVGVARFGVETLAGVPSILFGLFGYLLFVVAMDFGFSLLAASLAGACLVLPVIIRTSEEALRTVPRSYREGSLALGSTKWQTIWNVVLPSALPNIITGIVLSLGRVVSETAVFYVTLGGTYKTPKSIMSGGRTMALHVYYLAMETRAFDKAMGTGFILILTIILINLVINLISSKLAVKR